MKIVQILALSLLFLFAACSTDAATNNDNTNLENQEDNTQEQTTLVETKAREIKIDAFNFGYSLQEIKIKKGEKIKIIMTSSDGFHDFIVDELNVASEKINTGGTTEFEFTAETAGTFEFYCSVGRHRENGMVGTLIVEE